MCPVTGGFGCLSSFCHSPLGAPNRSSPDSPSQACGGISDTGKLWFLPPPVVEVMSSGQVVKQSKIGCWQEGKKEETKQVPEQLENKTWLFMNSHESFLKVTVNDLIHEDDYPVRDKRWHWSRCTWVGKVNKYFNFSNFPRFENCGIFIVMLEVIMKTLLRSTVVFVFLLVAFGLSFYVLLSIQVRQLCQGLISLLWLLGIYIYT